MRSPVLPLLLVLACSGEVEPVRGLETRVHLDRTEVRVGDAVGVTIEIDAPEGFEVEVPAAPPSDERFLTEQVERLEPLWLPGGLRHRILWRLRARSVGEHHLPEIGVPLLRPDGRIDRLPIGGIPLPVRSVRSELPEREAYFDLRPPPTPRGSSAWVWVGAGGALLAGLAVFLLHRRSAGARELESDRVGPLALRALSGLDAALRTEDGRLLADQLAHVLREFVRDRWTVEGQGWTPEELPAEVDDPIAAALHRIDEARFARRPERGPLLEAVSAVQTHLANVGHSH